MKTNIRLMVGMLLVVTGFFALHAEKRLYTAVPIIYCQDYDDVYDGRGNVKKPDWYMDFENQIIKEGTLVGATGKQHQERMQSGVSTIQFSHQFITTQATSAHLKELQKARKIPQENVGASIVQVCRVYYVMEPNPMNAGPKKLETSPVSLTDVD